jgi:hypothetical protein
MIGVAERELAVLAQRLELKPEELCVRHEPNASGPGNCMLVIVQYDIFAKSRTEPCIHEKSYLRLLAMPDSTRIAVYTSQPERQKMAPHLRQPDEFRFEANSTGVRLGKQRRERADNSPCCE